jgi:hypothetical protein
MTDQEKIEFCDLIESIIKDYRGNGQLLGAALGALVLAKYMGWKPVALLHSQATVRRYQTALGVYFKDVMPERGVYSYKSMALFLVDKFNNFWDVIQGRDNKTISKD